MAASTEPTVRLTIDMQHAVFETLRRKRLGFSDFAGAVDLPHLGAKTLVRLCQKTDPVVLRSDWESVASALQQIPRNWDRTEPPNEDALIYPYHYRRVNEIPTESALRGRAYRAQEKLKRAQAQAVGPI